MIKIQKAGQTATMKTEGAEIVTTLSDVPGEWRMELASPEAAYMLRAHMVAAALEGGWELI
jgi:hypothetical protein